VLILASPFFNTPTYSPNPSSIKPFAQTLLYSQTDTSQTNGILCRRNDPGTTFDTEGAEDFTVPNGSAWAIDSVIAFGFYNATAPATTKTIVTFYADNSGTPGSVIYTETINDGDLNGDGTLEPALSQPVVLSAGTYWLSVRIWTSAVPWYWYRITEEIGSNPFLWRNPGGGYNVCTSWQTLNSCLAIADSSVQFELYGCDNAPYVSFPADTTICEGETFTLSTGSANAAYQHAWSTSDTTSSIQIGQAGSYSVTVTNVPSNCSAEASIDVHVPNPILNTLSDDTSCLNTPVVFTTLACNTCSILWSTGSTAQNTSASTAGNVTVTVTDTLSGCQESDTATLTVIDPGLVLVPGNFADLCDGSDVTLSTSLAYEEYLWWDTQSPAETTDSITVESDGLYFVTVVDAFGCEAEDSVLVVLRPNPEPIIEKKLLSNGKVKLSTENPHSSYLWSTGDTTETVSVNANGLYYVTVTNEFGCEGEVFASVVNIGIDEAIAAQLKIYPNPASDYLNINWPATWVGKAKSVLYDPTGKVILSFSVDKQSQIVDLTALPAGSYILTTDSPDGMAKSTIIIQ
jgi:hypothetical protein